MTQGKRLLSTLNTRKDDARKQATAGFVPLLLVTNLARFLKKKKKTRTKKNKTKKNPIDFKGNRNHEKISTLRKWSNFTIAIATLGNWLKKPTHQLFNQREATPTPIEARTRGFFPALCTRYRYVIARNSK